MSLSGNPLVLHVSERGAQDNLESSLTLAYGAVFRLRRLMCTFTSILDSPDFRQIKSELHQALQLITEALKVEHRAFARQQLLVCKARMMLSLREAVADSAAWRASRRDEQSGFLGRMAPACLSKSGRGADWVTTSSDAEAEAEAEAEGVGPGGPEGQGEEDGGRRREGNGSDFTTTATTYKDRHPSAAKASMRSSEHDLAAMASMVSEISLGPDVSHPVVGLDPHHDDPGASSARSPPHPGIRLADLLHPELRHDYYGRSTGAWTSAGREHPHHHDQQTVHPPTSSTFVAPTTTNNLPPPPRHFPTTMEGVKGEAEFRQLEEEFSLEGILDSPREVSLSSLPSFLTAADQIPNHVTQPLSSQPPPPPPGPSAAAAPSAQPRPTPPTGTPRVTSRTNSTRQYPRVGPHGFDPMGTAREGLTRDPEVRPLSSLRRGVDGTTVSVGLGEGTGTGTVGVRARVRVRVGDHEEDRGELRKPQKPGADEVLVEHWHGSVHLDAVRPMQTSKGPSHATAHLLASELKRRRGGVLDLNRGEGMATERGGGGGGGGGGTAATAATPTPTPTTIPRYRQDTQSRRHHLENKLQNQDHVDRHGRRHHHSSTEGSSSTTKNVMLSSEGHRSGSTVSLGTDGEEEPMSTTSSSSSSTLVMGGKDQGQERTRFHVRPDNNMRNARSNFGVNWTSLRPPIRRRFLPPVPAVENVRVMGLRVRDPSVDPRSRLLPREIVHEVGSMVQPHLSSEIQHLIRSHIRNDH